MAWIKANQKNYLQIQVLGRTGPAPQISLETCLFLRGIGHSFDAR